MILTHGMWELSAGGSTQMSQTCQNCGTGAYKTVPSTGSPDALRLHGHEPSTSKPALPTSLEPSLPATCAAACDVPLCAVKQVLQSLEAPMMSSPGANRSTQRPKLVPRVPMEAGWSSLLVAPTVMTCRGGDEGGHGRDGLSSPSPLG